MATAKIISRVQLIDEKLNELKSEIAATKTASIKTADNKTAGSISKNTRSTKLYALGKERRILHLVRSLIEANPDIKLSEDDMNTFTLITTLSTEKKVYDAIEVHEGDKIEALMEKYRERKDLYKKLQAACEKAGLKLDFASNTVIKA